MSSSHLRPEQLASVLSLTLDAHLAGNLYHGWRVALVAHVMAADLSPSERAAVFYAGLLHDICTVSAPKHITKYPQLFMQVSDPKIKMHPEEGAGVLRDIPGMEDVAGIIEAHHEWWSGEGYPNNLKGSDIPIGAQFIRIVDTADMMGCYSDKDHLQNTLKQMHIGTGREWSGDVWAAFVHTFASGTLSKEILVDKKLPELIEGVLKDLPPVVDSKDDKLLDGLFTVFARVVDSKHPSCHRHSERVAEWAVAFGKIMGLPEKDIRKLRRAACVHDAGRIALPDSLLIKPDKLSMRELGMVHAHAELTDKLLRSLGSCRALWEIADIAARHHERYDGQGYPEGLAGEDIPLPARILAVADAYEAMTSDRAYREGVPPGIAMKRLMINAGTQFDSKVVDAIHSFYRANRAMFDKAWGVGALGAVDL